MWIVETGHLRTALNSNPRKLWTLRHSLHFWHLRTTISTFIITFYYKGNMGQHWQYFQMVHLCLSEVETGGNLSSLRQGEVLSSLEPGRKLLGHGNSFKRKYMNTTTWKWKHIDQFSYHVWAHRPNGKNKHSMVCFIKSSCRSSWLTWLPAGGSGWPSRLYERCAPANL